MSRTNRDDDDQRTGQDRSGPDQGPESTVAGSGYGTFLPSDAPEEDTHDIGLRDTPPPATEAASAHPPTPSPDYGPVSDLRLTSPVPSAQDATLADPSAAPSVVDGFRDDQPSTKSEQTPSAQGGSTASFEPSWGSKPIFTPTPPPGATPSGPGSGYASSEGGGLPSDAGAELQPGQVLGSRYRVISKLGKGGMGQVWLVRHLTLDADRALKLINPNRAFSKDFRDRFLREARAMARFVHPNVVTVHDADLRGQVAMIEMELVQGDSIDRLIKKGVPMPLDWVGRVLRQLCEVLQVAHEKQIVHRDLKPPNLMLLANGQKGQEFLKVLDFGIAKILGSDDQASDDAQTAAHTFMGTAPYTSPEQADGRAEPRSDIYSVGVILCEFLTGYRPFSGPLAKVIADTMKTKPPKFATLNPTANVPPGVEAVVQRCLEKDPNKRPQTPTQLWEEFLAALPKDVAEKVIGTYGPGTGSRKQARPKPSRRQVVAAVAATALIALAGLIFFWPDPPLPPPTPPPTPTPTPTPPPPGTVLPSGFVAVEGTTRLNNLPKRVVHTKTGAYFELIAGGKFTKGNWDQAEAPSPNCMLNDFYLQETEVTNRQMRDYLRTHADTAPPDLFQQAYDNLVPKVGKAEADLHPAVGISHELALAYARSIGATLPNEAQFEFAARSRGQKKRFPWGDEPGGPGENANIENDGQVPTVPVGKSPADRTAQGIFDLGGNVREWCLDVWDTLPAVQVGTPALYRPVAAQPGTTPQYVIRGGSHATTSDLAETTYRDGQGPADLVNADLGFRVAFEPRLSMAQQVSQKLEATAPATATRAATPTAPVSPSPVRAAAPAPEPRPALPPPAVPEQPAHDRWAVIIGVGQYRPGQFGPTGGADDAKRLRDWLVQNAGWEPSHVLLVADGGAAAPADANAPNDPPNMTIRSDRAGIDHAVRAWLGPRLKPGDFGLISFAGRVAAVPASNGPDDAGPARTVLVPADASRDRLARDGWALGDAIDALPARGACSIVCLLDTSVEGRGRGRAEDKVTRDPDASARLLASTARWPGVSAWLAATGNPSAEDSERRGLFTTSLIRAFGTSEAKRPLTAVLERLRRDPDLARQGFRTLGGIDPSLSVWEAPGVSSAIEDDPDYRLFLQQGHASRVSNLAFSADGSVLASSGDDSSVRLWRLEDPILLRNLAFHLAGVTRLALSPDGRLLVSGDGQGSVRGWDLASDREIVIDPTAGTPVRIDGLTFLPDGSLMAFNRSGVVRAWKPDGLRFRKIDEPATAAARRIVAARDPGPVLAAAIEIAAPNDRVVLISDPARAGTPIDDTPKDVAEIAISPDGSRLVIGTDSGRIEVRDLADASRGKLLKSAEIGAPIRSIDMAGSSGWFLVQSGQEAAPATSFVRLDDPTRQVPLGEVTAEIRQVSVQPGDGRIVVLTSDRAHAWDLGGEADAPRAIDLSGIGIDAPGTSSIAIDPNGTRLAIGSEDGGVRVRPFPGTGERGEAAGAIDFPSHLGQVAGLTASADGTHLLTIQRDGRARAWSMPARKARVIEGLYQPAGAFLAGTSLAALITQDGSIAIVDRETGRQRLRLDPPENTNWELTRLAASPDGHLLAAGSASLPLVAVWRINFDDDATKPPEPPTLLRAPHEGPIVGLAFADEGRSLITADDTGTVACWVIEGGSVQVAKGPTRTHKDNESPLFALAVESGTGTRVALGQGRFQGNRWRGRVSLWDRASDAVSTVSLDGVEGVLGTLAFTGDNAVLTAGGTSRRLYAWALLAGDRTRALNLRGGHDEQINAITPIAGAASGAVMATSSDDGTVRVWDLADPARPLRGTFAAQGQGTDWVAFTPSGLFDGSPSGVTVVARRSGPQVLRLEQFFERDFAFGVGATVLAGGALERVATDPSAAGARMILELDRAQVAVADAAQPGDGPPGPRLATLKVHLPGPDLTDLRVYHNGVAIRSEVPIEKTAGAASASVPVTLVQGRNRFHALASRGDRLDARSNDLDLPGPPAPPGRTHVLALGIDRYNNQQLAYATRDARELAIYLAAQAIGGKTQTIAPVVLLDENVSSGSVDDALKRIQAATDRHPEDSVVVFIAGHTDVRDDRYGLLLAGSDPAPGAKLANDDRLPYSMIHRRLARLDALQRLVIIDACQAGAILDDPAVRRIQEIVERESHATRTGYLLAARRGELAGEADELQHGLLTFSVLKGLGSDMAVPPTVADLFRERLNADRDNDLQIDTEELQSYVDQMLPELCRRYPSLVSRGRPDQPPTGAAQPPAPPAPEQKLRAQELQGPVFELTVLP